MKFTFEIKEDDLKALLAEKVKQAVEDYAKSYRVEHYIREQLAKQWENAASSLVKEALQNSPKMRTQIALALERKIKAQLEKVIKQLG